VKYIETNTTDPALNLAYEEYFLCSQKDSEPIFMIWQNRPTVVVGANQNTLKEVDINFLEQKNIALVRRTTGGGAVYHDLGNLCFSFIKEAGNLEELSFAEFLRPVKTVLDSFGLNVEISGRNDLLLDGRKISGSAARVFGGRVLFHGTLLYSSDLSVLAKALTVSKEKLALKGTPSVRSRVTLIADHMDQAPDVLTFKDRLVESFREAYDANEYVPTKEEVAAVHELAKERYRDRGWTFGKNPPSNVYFHRRFTLGEIGVRMMISEARIEHIHFEGDYLAWLDSEDVAKALTGVPYERAEIEQILERFEQGGAEGENLLALYFGGIERRDIVSVIMGDQ
jgi:lipoate-protein ligase A